MQEASMPRCQIKRDSRPKLRKVMGNSVIRPRRKGAIRLPSFRNVTRRLPQNTRGTRRDA
jgi:hypothetical protein